MRAAADPGEEAARCPRRPKAAFKIGAPVPLARHRDETTWAAVRDDVVARSRRRARARAVGTLRALTPEATTNIVLPLARRHLWVKVRLPALPNGTTGWVPRAALGAYGTVRTRLVVDLAKRRLTLLKDGRTVLRVPVGVGAPDAPTPRGQFVVRNVLTRFSSKFYGPIALGTSARSETLTDWPGGGYVGIHGTDQPGPDPGRGLARLHPPAQRGHRPARARAPDRDAADDPLALTHDRHAVGEADQHGVDGGRRRRCGSLSSAIVRVRSSSASITRPRSSVLSSTIIPPLRSLGSSAS